MKNLTSLEPLETRIAPATIFAIDDSNGLFSFDSADPATVSATIPITGLLSHETMKTIDFRPTDGLLYGVAISVSFFTARLYQIDTATGAATQAMVSPITSTLPATSAFGMDFDPTTGFLRFVHTSVVSLKRLYRKARCDILRRGPSDSFA